MENALQLYKKPHVPEAVILFILFFKLQHEHTPQSVYTLVTRSIQSLRIHSVSELPVLPKDDPTAWGKEYRGRVEDLDWSDIELHINENGRFIPPNIRDFQS